VMGGMGDLLAVEGGTGKGAKRKKIHEQVDEK
jgi:hypothetical protein